MTGHGSSGWKNEKHRTQWLNTINQYVNPVIGNKPISEIQSDDIMHILTPIWTSKEETARRVKQRMKTIFIWAKAKKFYSGDCPVENIDIALPKQKRTQSHYKALAYNDVSAFYDKLANSHIDVCSKCAFQFLILTATRTKEVLHAKWEEFDLDASVWTIPAERMKAGRPHRVPLGEEGLKIITLMKSISSEHEHVFINLRTVKPYSNMVFLQVLKRLGENTTAHGFRSAFRDWASEETDTPNEICEMALAHTIKDKTEKAYRRGDLFEKRKRLMQGWEDHVLSSRRA